MSRLIVKGLPKRYDEGGLRGLFGKVGEVTDAKVMRSPSGQSRMFGYVGFRTAKDAENAVLKFNKTFVGASRIIVDYAKEVGDSSIPRPWSKYSKGSSRFAEKEQEKKQYLHSKEARMKNSETRKRRRTGSMSKMDGNEEDPRYLVFKDVMRSRSEKNIWADTEVVKISDDGTRSKKRMRVINQKPEDREDDDAQEIKKGLKSLPKGKEQDERKFYNMKLESDTVSDFDYLRSKVRNNLNDESDEEDFNKEEGQGRLQEILEEVNSGSDSEKQGSRRKEPIYALSDPRAADENGSAVNVAETGRLFVRNLPYSVKEEELDELFEPFGKLAEVHLVLDASTKKSRGIAFILFVIPENAAVAMASLDGKQFAGRLLHILPGRTRPQDSVQKVIEGDCRTGFQRERERAKKAAAKDASDKNVYNALFMSSDAVASVLAERYGVTKSVMYGTDRGESGSAAVRIATGEAQLQAETKSFFSAQGVELDSLNSSSKKRKLSKKAFLVKNLPGRAQKLDLEEKFSSFGEIKKLLVAPSGLLAVVEFVEVSSAKRAYASTAYTRMNDAPMYLEWLPEAAVHSPAGKQNIASVNAPDDRNVQNTMPDAEGEDAAYGQAPATSVFVKNLNFDTTDVSLRTSVLAALEKKPKVKAALRSASVSSRPDPKNPDGKRLSNGFGFLEFSSPAFAEDAVRLAQGTLVDGFVIELTLSKKRAPSSMGKGQRISRKDRKASSKLVVKNVAFEATMKDVRALFAAFGQVKSIRMPRKFDGSKRGFAFIEFVSKNEAVGAYEALGDAHLYGRHLVIDFADTANENGFTSMQESMEKARKQAPAHSNRRVRDMEEEEDDEMSEMYT